MKTSAYAIWSVRWKGVVVVCNNKGSMTDNMELYDLDEDPFEIQDISESFPEQVELLKNVIAFEDDISCKCFQNINPTN